MDINAIIPASGRLIAENGTVVNIVDILNTLGVAPASDQRLDIEAYAARSGRILGEDGQMYNLVDLLAALAGGGGGGGGNMPEPPADGVPRARQRNSGQTLGAWVDLPRDDTSLPIYYTSDLIDGMYVIDDVNFPNPIPHGYTFIMVPHAHNATPFPSLEIHNNANSRAGLMNSIDTGGFAGIDRPLYFERPKAYVVTANNNDGDFVWTTGHRTMSLTTVTNTQYVQGIPIILTRHGRICTVSCMQRTTFHLPLTRTLFTLPSGFRPASNVPLTLFDHDHLDDLYGSTAERYYATILPDGRFVFLQHDTIVWLRPFTILFSLD